MPESIKTQLLSAHEDEVLSGLRSLTAANLYAHLPRVMEIIRGRGRAADPAVKIVSGLIKGILARSDANLAEDVRNAFVRLLLQLEPDVTDRIAKEYTTSDPKRKMDLLQLLRAFGDGKTSVKVLSEALRDNHRLVRACAVKTLGTLANSREPGIVIRFFSDKDSRVRANAIEAMEESDNANLVGVLIRLKSDTNNRVRANVLKTLYKFGYKEIKKDLITMLRSPDELMRASAAWVVGELGRKNADFPLLLEMIKNDGSPLVQTNMLLARDKIARSRTADRAAKTSPAAKSVREEIVSRSAVKLTREKTRYFEVFRVQGRLNVYSVLPLRLEAQEVLESGTKEIAFDFSEVDDADPAVIRFLKNLNRRIKTVAGKFMVFGIRREVMDIFHMADLDSTVLLFSEEEKVDHLM